MTDTHGGGSRPHVAVLDYGSGNLRSAERALEQAGARVTVTGDFDIAKRATGLFIPGVGAFAACMTGLEAVQGRELVGERLASKSPVLGVCVGMQVLFERGVEHGAVTQGLGCWPGTVERLSASVVPHMGWNEVKAPAGSRLFHGIGSERFYFVHSYAVQTWGGGATKEQPGPVVTWSHHGGPFVAAVEDGPLTATQFHPEKSGAVGVALLRNWLTTL